MQRKLTFLLVIALLPLASCGARWNSAQRADMRRRAAGASQVAARTADDRAATGDSTDTGTGDSTDTGAGGGSSTGSGSNSDASTGSGVSAGSKKLACAAHSTEVGVSDTTLTIGSISSLTGPVPGLGGSAAGAARAYVAYRNATGGICGRKVVLKEADDGTDNGHYRSIINDYSSQVFGVAGGFALGDVGGVDVIKQTKIPVVNAPGQQASADLPTLFDINPKFENEKSVVIGKYKYLHDHGATKASVTYQAVDQSRFEANLQIQLMKNAGIQVVQVQELPLSTLSYDSAARGVANSGADYLLFIGAVDANQSMARSMKDTGYKLKWPEYYVYSYGTNFIQATGDAGEGAITWLRALPIEDRAKNKELQTFLQWTDRVAPGADQDAFAEDSWSSTKAFFDNVEKIPGPITRDALVKQLNSVGTYDADGMFGTIELGKEFSNGCFVGLQVQHGAWQRLYPASGFTCIA